MRVSRFHQGRWCDAAAEEVAATQQDSDPPQRLTLLTYNVCSRGGSVFDRNAEERAHFLTRMHAVTDVLMEEAADIVCLQELTILGLEVVLRDARVRDQYYTSDATGSTLGRFGVLVLSRFPFVQADLLNMSSGMGRSLLRADVAVSQSHTIRIGTIHLDSLQGAASSRSTQLEQASSQLLASTVLPVALTVLCGDMNFTEGPQEEQPLTQRGWQDVWSALGHTDAAGTTIGINYPSEAYAPARFDRVYVHGSAVPVYRAVSARVFGGSAVADGLFPSDHLGVRTEWHRQT